MRNFLILMTGAAILTGCFHGKNDEMGPSETVEAFCKALTAGDFDKAESFCDTLMMRGYVGRLKAAWESADSSVMTIIPAILSETVISVTDVVKEGRESSVFYELTATDGTGKKKTASLEKEEGAWKIKAITDRH